MKPTSATLFFFMLLGTIAITAFAAYSFLSGINESSLLLSTGNAPIRKITRPYDYNNNVQGFIFAGTFFVAGIFLFIMILLPSDKATAKRGLRMPPQPKDDESQIAKVAKEEAGRIGTEAEVQEGVPPAEKAAQPDAKPKEDFPEIPEGNAEGEDDVVYGAGMVTDEAIINFVNKYTDSALKFLYRKDLDGKGIRPADEDIYITWEARGLTRSKVREYILQVMDWDAIPNEHLSQIWKRVRDRIFDLTH